MSVSASARLRKPRAPSTLATARAWVTATADRLGLCRSLGYFALTRLSLFIVAACAIRIVPAGIQSPTEVYLGQSLSIATWVRWDSWWYLNVVERGYWFDPTGKSNVAFFPLFPLTIKALTAVTGNQVVAGLLIANLAAVGGVIAFWVWVRDQAGPVAAERAVLWLLVFPFSFFFHSIYAESLFFLLATLAFIAAGRKRWPLAGLWGGLAAATRPMGVLLFPAFAWPLYRRWRAGHDVEMKDVLGVCLVPAGLAAYAVYLWLAFGNPLAFWDAHANGWNVRFHWDLAGYWRETYWILTRGPRIQAYTRLLDSLRVVLPLVFIALTVKVFHRLGSTAGIYTAATVFVGVLFAPESVGRELLAAVPAFAAAGIADRDGSLAEGLRLLSFGLLVVFLFAFATAHFVG
ncbi:MAG TPA: mannosyltransferase family protein [Methylomirabilota bacterium]|nr:mannosyltransferase family protein [Methylomirabilota bacterium]